jgi:hypothetical protein
MTGSAVAGRSDTVRVVPVQIGPASPDRPGNPDRALTLLADWAPWPMIIAADLDPGRVGRDRRRQWIYRNRRPEPYGSVAATGRS